MVEDCFALTGGGFHLDSMSILRAFETVFVSNRAIAGGAVSLGASSTFEATGCEFKLRNAYLVRRLFAISNQDLGRGRLRRGVKFLCCNELESNTALDTDGGVAYIRYSSSMKVRNSWFEGNHAGRVRPPPVFYEIFF